MDSIGTYGCPIENITPNIDRLAAEGIQFDRGFVNVAICMPCRAVLMTGRYPQASGALGFDKINPEVPSLPEALKKAGYYNSLIGKENPRRSLPPRGLPPHRQTKRPRRRPRCRRLLPRPSVLPSRRPRTPTSHSSSWPTRPTRTVPLPERRAMPSKKIPFPRKIDPKQVPVPGFLPDLPDIRAELATYFQSVARADQVVGAVLDELKKSGQADNTLVLFLSDHGMPLPYAKTNCYLASNITPFILRWPGHIKSGTTDEKNFVSTIDVAPTFLAAAGVENLEGANGLSLLSLMKGTETTRSQPSVHLSSATLLPEAPADARG